MFQEPTLSGNGATKFETMETMTTIEERLAEHFEKLDRAGELNRRRTQAVDTELRTARQAFAHYARLEILPRLEQARDFLLVRHMGAAILEDLEPAPGKPSQVALCFANAFMPPEKVRLHPQYKVTVRLPDLSGVQFEVIGARGKPQARKEGIFALHLLPRGKEAEELILRGVMSCIPVPPL